MTERSPRNTAASVHQRLKNEAGATGQLFNELLLHYALERFLYRLSKSDQGNRFVLKGALLLRVQFAGKLGNARIPMQVDIGFGDPITPAPEVVEYPTVLGMDPPRIRVYPPETAIAEKFQVMLYRGLLNSRMKDYFDIWALARSMRFEGAVLSEAILRTCESRGTAMNSSPVALSEEALLDADKQVQWRAFHRRITPTAAPESFAKIVREVAAFLLPVAKALSAGARLSGHWAPGGPWS